LIYVEALPLPLFLLLLFSSLLHPTKPLVPVPLRNRKESKLVKHLGRKSDLAEKGKAQSFDSRPSREPYEQKNWNTFLRHATSLDLIRARPDLLNAPTTTKTITKRKRYPIRIVVAAAAASLEYPSRCVETE
jgi:hypothetical protein